MYYNKDSVLSKELSLTKKETFQKVRKMQNEPEINGCSIFGSFPVRNPQLET